jgi:hypothetical protein
MLQLPEFSFSDLPELQPFNFKVPEEPKRIIYVFDDCTEYFPGFTASLNAFHIDTARRQVAQREQAMKVAKRKAEAERLSSTTNDGKRQRVDAMPTLE